MSRSRPSSSGPRGPVPLRAALAGLALSAGLSGTALAQAPAAQPDQSALRQFCSGDYMRFCAAFQPGTPQLEQCFAARMNDLSPNCRGAIADYQKKTQPTPARR